MNVDMDRVLEKARLTAVKHELLEAGGGYGKSSGGGSSHSKDSSPYSGKGGDKGMVEQLQHENQQLQQENQQLKSACQMQGRQVENVLHALEQMQALEQIQQQQQQLQQPWWKRFTWW